MTLLCFTFPKQSEVPLYFLVSFYDVIYQWVKSIGYFYITPHSLPPKKQVKMRVGKSNEKDFTDRFPYRNNMVIEIKIFLSNCHVQPPGGWGAQFLRVIRTTTLLGRKKT